MQSKCQLDGALAVALGTLAVALGALVIGALALGALTKPPKTFFRNCLFTPEF